MSVWLSYIPVDSRMQFALAILFVCFSVCPSHFGEHV